MNRIIFENADGSLGVITPMPACIELLAAQLEGGIDAALSLIAEKDVPKGLPYWIVPTDLIPTDRTDRQQWRLDGSEGDPHGYGALSNEFPPEIELQAQPVAEEITPEEVI